MTDYQETRPDWVMCGMPSGDGQVMILASTELSRVQLEAERDRFDVMLDLLEPVRMSSTRYSLAVQMQGFVIVVADTYEQAFRSLFEQWTPARATAPVGGRRREITG